jgi:hypothetical protein
MIELRVGQMLSSPVDTVPVVVIRALRGRSN